MGIHPYWFCDSTIFLLLCISGFLSPIPAIGCAVVIYSRHCRARPEHRLPGIAYILILLVCAIIAFPFGTFYGISWACSSPECGNLCGVFGFFVTGPFASSIAILLIGGLVMSLPPDQEP
jgi:hypothetical protein